MSGPSVERDASIPALAQPAPRKALFSGCWGCRVTCGAGLLCAGGYVFMAARTVLKRGGPARVGTVAQIFFSACLASWGIVILADPVGKSQRKT
ncbi:distal membrane-arm assembly complex protein 1-like [Acipenser ruthenus]|uniref:distal membrane-arm assembly complex protein 1-like n=1 Tax=Acipenser ruthenus TaxID=7906 RepID=UPI002740E5E5|nr:distal membrane-arm assembly complex protein 1-like [Acipenser ruthenus]